MIIYHFLYDLNEFLGVAIDLNTPFWRVYTRTYLLFIFVSGVSTGFSRKPLFNALRLLGFAAGISLSTYLALGDQYVRFGILHFLGVCMLLHFLLKRLEVWQLLALAAGILGLAPRIGRIKGQTGWLLPLGITYPGFRTIDYFPLFPYLAVFIMGMIAYKLYYHKGRSLFKFSWENPVITWISKNSLWIYLIHQPVILAGIFLYKYLAQ
ncbi:MAG: DUF1624 domain-containing protein [Firmicutes bacterium]|nr:DUF1624 domain-containing protein [Bacillota bacterium]